MQKFVTIALGAAAVVAVWWLWRSIPGSDDLASDSAESVETRQTNENVATNNGFAPEAEPVSRSSDASDITELEANALAGAANYALSKAMFEAVGKEHVDRLVSSGLARVDAEAIVLKFMEDVASCPEEQRPPRADPAQSPCYLDALQRAGLAVDRPVDSN